MNDPYNKIIEQYLYTEFPTTTASKETQFEAVSAAVLGTKQRRYGPALSPEHQVKVREVLQRDGPIYLFSPWGASKQEHGRGLDIAEVSAVKQLSCLREELWSYGREAQFSFRLEDLTDRYLLGDDWLRRRQIGDYVANFTRLTELVLPGSKVRLESDVVEWEGFRDTADAHVPVFLTHIKRPTADSQDSLGEIGWRGTLPQEQQDYYRAAYAALGYPASLHDGMIAKYYAATLARVKLKAVRSPDVPYIVVAFTHPVPGNPVPTPRVYYRTIPERYTNTHRSPWLAQAYLRIDRDNDVTPRFVQTGEQVRIVENKINWHGVLLHADYAEG